MLAPLIERIEALEKREAHLSRQRTMRAAIQSKLKINLERTAVNQSKRRKSIEKSRDHSESGNVAFCFKSGGLMNPAQASAFIRMVQNTPTIFSESRVIQMENDSQKFEKIGFGQRILRAAQEGKALSNDELTVPTTSTVQLNTKEVIAEINITYDTLENNIEKTAYNRRSCKF